MNVQDDVYQLGMIQEVLKQLYAQICTNLFFCVQEIFNRIGRYINLTKVAAIQ